MISVGSKSTLQVSAKVPAGLLLTDGENEVLLPNKFVPTDAKEGTNIEVFVYTDSEDRPVATTQEPHAMVGDFACLKVVDTSAHGAFLDWGLDKDLFVPKSEQHQPLQVGRSYVVAVFLDNATNRVAAASRLGEFLDYDVSGVNTGARVKLLVYGFTDRGAQVLVDNKHSGLIFESETFRRLNIGDKLSGYVAAVRPDNKLDIQLQRTGAGGNADARAIVLRALEENGGRLELGDRSPPEKIYEQLGLSKKAFKAIIGGLYKEGLLVLSPLEVQQKEPDKGSR